MMQLSQFKNTVNRVDFAREMAISTWTVNGDAKKKVGSKHSCSVLELDSPECTKRNEEAEYRSTVARSHTN